MPITQLNPTIPVYLPDFMVNGQALLVIDPGTEHHLLWVVARDDNGEIWTLPNPKVRVQYNVTMGRTGDMEDATHEG